MTWAVILWQLRRMMQPNAMLNPDERTQFVEAFEDNLDLLVDLVEAVRCESASVGDKTAAEFMAGVSRIICAFRSSHEAGEPHIVGDTDRLWSRVPTQVRQVDNKRAFESTSSLDIG